MAMVGRQVVGKAGWFWRYIWLLQFGEQRQLRQKWRIISRSRGSLCWKYYCRLQS